MLHTKKDIEQATTELIQLIVDEVSAVDRPAVPLARWLVLKNEPTLMSLYKIVITKDAIVLPYRNLSVSDSRSWDGRAAEASIKNWSKKSDGEIDFDKYSRGFLIRDGEKDNVTSYKYPIAKVENGRLVVPFGALIAAAAALKGGRVSSGSTQVAESVRRSAFNQIRKYYKKLNIPDKQIPMFTKKLFQDKQEKQEVETMSVKTKKTDKAIKADAGAATDLPAMKIQLTDVFNMMENGDARDALNSIIASMPNDESEKDQHMDDENGQEAEASDAQKTILDKLDQIISLLQDNKEENGKAEDASDATATTPNNGDITAQFSAEEQKRWEGLLGEIQRLSETGALKMDQLIEVSNLLTSKS